MPAFDAAALPRRQSLPAHPCSMGLSIRCAKLQVRHSEAQFYWLVTQWQRRSASLSKAHAGRRNLKFGDPQR